MNKAALMKLAKEQDSKKESGTPPAAAQTPVEAPVAKEGASTPPEDGEGREALQRTIYAALVGGADIRRSQSGTLAICRWAYKTSKEAVDVWDECREKEQRA